MGGAAFDVVVGLLAGVLLAATGGWFAVRTVARHEAALKAKDGRWDVWSTWGVGVLVRLLLFGLLAWGLWAFCERFVLAMLILLAVYLVGWLAETAWLHRRLCGDTQGHGHG